jgi:radical SAM/Cys-rich protein
MTAETVDKVLELLQCSPAVHTVDITGGAPEMNPHFRRLVTGISALGKKVIDRCNLTIIFEEGYADIPELLAEHDVTVVASLPCYSKENVEKQRGKGVFGKSIRALTIFNELGYGKGNPKRELSLVYNPVGASLPPSQARLEADYKVRLKEDFQVEFDKLFTITNMPIKRFLHQLKQWGKHEEYMQLLIDNFNPSAALDVMCRNLLSISWDGLIYDCDFNQMLDLPTAHQKTSVMDIDSFDDFLQSEIVFADHCYGCTAGAGSSCGGSLTE